MSIAWLCLWCLCGQWILAWGRAWRRAPPAGGALRCVTRSLGPPAGRTWSWPGFLLGVRGKKDKLWVLVVKTCLKMFFDVREMLARESTYVFEVMFPTEYPCLHSHLSKHVGEPAVACKSPSRASGGFVHPGLLKKHEGTVWHQELLRR